MPVRAEAELRGLFIVHCAVCSDHAIVFSRSNYTAEHYGRRATVALRWRTGFSVTRGNARSVNRLTYDSLLGTKVTLPFAIGTRDVVMPRDSFAEHEWSLPLCRAAMR